MEGRLQTSFIPKKPVVTETQTQSSVSIVLLISVIIFIISCSASVGVFAYTQYLNNQITTNKATLVKASEAFEPALIEALIRVNDRLDSATTLLTSHASPSIIFSEIESYTLQSVRFKSFQYMTANDGTLSVAMKGQAKDFTSIALQSDVLAKSRHFKSPVLSNLTLLSDGSVSFDFRALVDPSFVSYKNSLPGAQASVSNQSAQVNQAVVSSPTGF